MKTANKILLLAAAVVSLAACSKSRPQQMAMADNVKITSTPEVLEAFGDKIPVQVSVTYPEGYFHPDVVMVVTPVLVYEGGEQVGQVFTYQGERVKDNNTVVPNKGGSVLEKLEFTYAPGMEKSYLELRSEVFYGKKRIEVPAAKVADGLIVTSRMADVAGAFDYKADGYQHVIRQFQEGQILYDVNSSTVKGSQLRSESISNLKAALVEMSKDERYSVIGTQVIAYASPEGGQAYNAKLSDKRAGTAENAWKKISKGLDADEVKIESVGQDWEGFKEAVSASNIQDKDLILRVLSMYSDPAVREREIRNMSEIFSEINKQVFPALRRARFVTEVEYQNYSDEELESLSKTALGMLDESAVLRIATNAEDPDRKASLYAAAAEKFNSQTALYNLATLSLAQGKPATAEAYLKRLDNADEGDAKNLAGVIALQRGNYEEALADFKAAGTDDAKQNIAALDLVAGNYADAAAALEGTGSTNEALSMILSGQYDKAAAALTGDDARTDYLRAILAARTGKADDVRKFIAAAGDKDASYKEKAANDIEFAKYR